MHKYDGIYSEGERRKTAQLMQFLAHCTLSRHLENDSTAVHLPDTSKCLVYRNQSHTVYLGQLSSCGKHFHCL